MSQLEDAVAAAEAGDKNKAYVILAALLKTEPNNVDAWVALSEIVDDEKQKRTFLTRALTLKSDHARAASLLHQLDSPPTPEVVADLSFEAESDDVDMAELEPAADEAEPVAEVESDPLPEVSEPAVQSAPDDTVLMPAAEVAALRQQIEPEPTDTVVDARPISGNAEDFESQATGDTIPPWLMGEDGSIIPEAEALESVLEPEGVASAALEPEVPDWLREELADSWEDEPAPEIMEDEPLSTREITSVAPAAPKAAKKQAPKRSKKQLDRMFSWLILAFVLVGAVALYFLLQVVTELNLLG